MKELRFRLDGKRVVFPDGRELCLACGEEARWAKRVKLRLATTSSGTDQAGLERVFRWFLPKTLKMDAPLCEQHHDEAERQGLLRAFWLILAQALMLVGILLLPADYRKLWPVIGLSITPFLALGLRAQKRSERGNLDAIVRQEGEDYVVKAAGI